MSCNRTIDITLTPDKNGYDELYVYDTNRFESLNGVVTTNTKLTYWKHKVNYSVTVLNPLKVEQLLNKILGENDRNCFRQMLFSQLTTAIAIDNDKIYVPKLSVIELEIGKDVGMWVSEDEIFFTTVSTIDYSDNTVTLESPIPQNVKYIAPAFRCFVKYAITTTTTNSDIKLKLVLEEY